MLLAGAFAGYYLFFLSRIPNVAEKISFLRGYQQIVIGSSATHWVSGIIAILFLLPLFRQKYLTKYISSGYTRLQILAARASIFNLVFLILEFLFFPTGFLVFSQIMLFEQIPFGYCFWTLLCRIFIDLAAANIFILLVFVFHNFIKSLMASVIYMAVCELIQTSGGDVLFCLPTTWYRILLDIPVNVSVVPVVKIPLISITACGICLLAAGLLFKKSEY